MHFSAEAGPQGFFMSNGTSTALHGASSFGHSEVVKLLITTGANVDIVAFVG